MKRKLRLGVFQMNRYVFRWMTVVLLNLTFLGVAAWAQSGSGSVRGIVQDQSGAVIPNATVSIFNTATGIETKAVSNDAGLYVFPSLIPGPYRVASEFPGMEKFQVDITVEVEHSSTVNVLFKLFGTATAIDVKAITPMVSTDTVSLGQTLENARIEQLPINGRQITNLLATVPGVTTDDGGQLRTYGARVGTHDLMLDGAIENDRYWADGAIQRQPALESIQEVRVENNSSSAKYTRQTSIIMTTKNGTNEVHGSLFETNRDNFYGVARARDNFTGTAAKLIRNEYGGSVGGPILLPKLYDGKNRTFFFFAYEGLKQRQGVFGNFKVPTEAMRNGDFSGLTDSLGRQYTIYNPWSTQADGTRSPFDYGGQLNHIDPSLESPLYKQLISVVPLPNRPGNPIAGASNYSAAASSVNDQSTWSLRFDHHFSDRDQFYARMSVSALDSTNYGAGGMPMLDKIGNSSSSSDPNKSIALNWTHTFSPTLFNELMISGTRQIALSSTGDPTAKYATLMGLPNPANQAGYPVISNIGVGTGSSNYFQPTNTLLEYFSYFVLEDNATKIHGHHEFQFGVHLRHDQMNLTPMQQQSGGSVSFPLVATALWDQTVPNRAGAVPYSGNVAASAYLGLASYAYRVNKGRYYLNQNEDALYFQDNIRATRRLTLHLGVRWQYSPFAKDKYNVFSSFDTKNMAIVLGQPLDYLYKVNATSPGLVSIMQADGAKFETAAEAGLPKDLINNNWHDISPHLGFAYRGLDGSKSFVLRGGFSSSYFPIPLNTSIGGTRLNAPFLGMYSYDPLTNPALSPDGLPNYGLVGTTNIIAGKNSANAISLNNPTGITIGSSDSFRAAYFNPNQPTSRVYDWNLTLEKEVMTNTVLRLAYIGNHGSDMDVINDMNPTIPDYTLYMNYHEPLQWGSRWQALRRPNSTTPYGDIWQYTKNGYSNSNGGQVEFERRYTKGYGFQVFYTMMNMLDTGNSNYGMPTVLPTSYFVNGTVPTDYDTRLRFLLYQRDANIPKHEIRWNWIVDLPFGKGKFIGRNAGGILNAFIGGWELSGLGRLYSNYITIPGNGSDLYPTGTKIQYYGHKYPIKDCRSGVCQPGYLMWNGYIPAYQINQPNGVMGVPADYKPAVAPLNPFPANYLSLSASSDPMYNYYGTSMAQIPLNDGTVQPYVADAALSPYQNQYIGSTWNWTCDASIFKSFPIRDRVSLRVQFDFFNAFNHPGDSPAAGGDGTVQTWTNLNTPRTMQLSAHLTW